MGAYSTGASPFMSERARARAPQVLSYAAVSGSAFLISPKGEVVLFTGSSTDVDMVRVAHVASQRLANGSDVISFCHEDLCVHAAPVAMGWVLCILSTIGLPPSMTVDRLRRTSALLALALVNGPTSSSSGSDKGGGGTPAEVFAARLPNRK
jgi:hypothetical protein